MPLKPGSCAKPFFGQVAEILDEKGQPVETGSEGFLVLTRPWPSMLRTLYGDDERYVKLTGASIPGKYFTGDSARRDKDGYYWIIGRVDDVIKVSGHRLGTAEVESALLTHPAVVGVGRHRPAPRAQRTGHLLLHPDQNGQRADGRAEGGPPQARLHASRPHCQARSDPVRRQAAQDPLRQDHAPCAEGARPGTA